jgi:hypothetical protein
MVFGFQVVLDVKSVLLLTKLGQQRIPLSFMSNYKQGIFRQCKVYYLLVLMDPSK